MRLNDEKKAAEAAKRAKKVQWYRRLWDLVSAIDKVGHGNVEVAVAAACLELNLKRASFYLYLKRYRKDPRFASLSPRLTGLRQKREKRGSEEAHELLDQYIDKEYLTREKRPATAVYKRYETACWTKGIKPLSQSTMERKIDLIPEEVIARRRDPEELRGHKYRLNHDAVPIAFAPLEVVQMDHRELDIEAVDSEHRLPCGRPWFTAVVDHYTRAVLGFYLTLDAPSSISTARALLHAATPKAGWMEKLELLGVWEMHGIPSTVYTDNGSDFTSEAIGDGYRRQGINPPMFRPGGQPQYGGIVERMLLTLGFIFKGEGGDTGKSPEDRGDRDASASACLTLTEMERMLTNYIANDYHVDRMSKDASPRLMWRKSLDQGLFQMRNLSDEALRHMYIDFLPTETKVISQRGVRVDNLYFSHPILNKWLAIGKTKHDFHVDWRDARFIYFRDPEDGTYHDIPNAIPELAPISFKDANIRLKEIHAESDDLIDYDELMASRDLNIRIGQSAAEKTKSKKAVISAEKRRRSERPSVVEALSPERAAQAASFEEMLEEDDEDEVIVAFEIKTIGTRQ